MATEVTLPALGESVTEGTVTQWLKSVGDEIAVDEPLLEVSTDKVDTEIPSPVAGTLLEIKASEDETVEVGAVLAVIGAEGESGVDGAAAQGEDTQGESAQDEDAQGESAQDEDAQGESAQDEDAQGESAQDEDAQGESAQDESAQAQEPAEESASKERDDGGDDDSTENTSQQSQPSEDTSQQSQPSEDAEDTQTDEGAQKQPPSETAPAARADARSSSGGDSAAASTDVTLPELGESVTEGTVTQWLKSVGDDVAVDEPLLEVSTDKVDTEIPSPVAGTLLEIRADADETVEVGGVLAVIGSGSPPDSSGEAPAADDDAEPEKTPEPAPDEKPEPEPEAEKEEAEPEAAKAEESEQQATQDKPSANGGEARATPGEGEQPSSTSSDGKSYVTPLVRKLASQHSVDLAGVTGTGVGGRIRKQDVLEAAKAAEQAAPAPAAETPAASAPAATPSPLRGKTEKLSRLRKVIATRMVESLQVSAQLTTVVEVDVTAISRLRDRHKAAFEQREGVKLSFLPFFAKAAVDALKTYPQVNASIDTEAGTVTYHDGEHLGVAVDTERGLLVPVISNAGDLSIAGLSRKIADLAERTRNNKINPDELSGGTFTLTNTGSRGALFDTPIINQPQVAILGTGTVVKRAVVLSDPRLGETIGVRQMAYLALTYDHRLVDGADAARFLSTVKQRLEEANFEAELGG